MVKKLWMLSAAMFLGTNLSYAGTYEADKAHSSVNFSVTHLMVSRVNGAFDDLDAKITFDPADLAGSSVDAAVKAASINTKNADRDKHLKSADFFDAEKFPEITFKTSAITGSDKQYILEGELTLHGMTKKVSIPVTIAGPIKSPFGFDAIGITGQFKLNRQDYGVSWNKTLDSGGVMVSDDVDVAVSIEAHSPAAK